jgi:hypothetical protein
MANGRNGNLHTGVRGAGKCEAHSGVVMRGATSIRHKSEQRGPSTSATLRGGAERTATQAREAAGTKEPRRWDYRLPAQAVASDDRYRSGPDWTAGGHPSPIGPRQARLTPARPCRSERQDPP